MEDVSYHGETTQGALKTSRAVALSTSIKQFGFTKLCLIVVLVPRFLGYFQRLHILSMIPRIVLDADFSIYQKADVQPGKFLQPYVLDSHEEELYGNLKKMQEYE